MALRERTFGAVQVAVAELNGLLGDVDDGLV